MTMSAHPASWNTSPITASLHVPVNPDAAVELPHVTCQPMVGSAEAAVLFAAGHAEAARLCLEDACGRRPHDQRAWSLLLDLTTEEELRPVFDYARTHKLVAVDLSGLVRIGFEVAPKLCAALRLFALQSKRVILTHVSPLHAELLAAIGLHPEVKVLARRSGADAAGLPGQSVLQAA